MKLCIVTSNKNKAREVAEYFSGVSETEHVQLECPEYRDSDVAVIFEKKAEYAYEQIKKPLITDDTGFFIDALNGFPGPYAAYVHDTIGNNGILKLLDGVENRNAHFKTAVAYADEKGINVFVGRVDGKIVLPRGDEGFGYDPIFEVEGKTLAEISVSEKSRMSHRARALQKFREWYIKK